ncbi:MAG: plasma-membrane proton-efflux P-type ATPase [Desulfarculaceae bacterium]|nr:plasma-membrane proton-efflux P-type ATPase [Desulfarculaceae bacterium]MCF8065564.1 plasma-membrane proton-efflux P-type ATPase [Desulfarculaceae bacterium]MCF8098877.1 plasma-membrane proton-efflux P-type ATPase [Desulfarculaceae bacterium]MCF8123488.1 plasma-membrane proton-efflux P-type ATPase [Desulfarculaceae bacterium]
MPKLVLESQDTEGLSLNEAFERLNSGQEGLSPEEAKSRLAQVGLNTIVEQKKSALLKLLGYFWGPIPWMIEAAAVLSLIVRHWSDMIIICVMLVFNAAVGFWQERKADNALEALKGELALRARVRRGGQWQEISAEELVPGDVVRLRAGDILPADLMLFEGEYLSVDQSALTGESLPVDKAEGDVAYSGSVAKQGEMQALVVATGERTKFAKTVKLVESAEAPSHFQKAVLTIGDYLIYISLGLATALVLTQLVRGDSALGVFQFVLILVVASIPVAMPAVLSLTMALGALTLAKEKAIVSRLQSIEEIAGIDVLCSDKTGTLTKNQLTLGEPEVFAATDAQELILAASLASKEENRDAIDDAVLGGLKDQSALSQYQQEKFTPFDPVSKRTEATIKGGGVSFKCSKGAPQVMADLCGLEGEERRRAQETVDKLAATGYRTLGVARTDEGGKWRFLGLLPLYDPPRDDSAETIAQAEAHGINVKMVTGDNLAIAREISRQLHMRPNIQVAEELFSGEIDPANPPLELGEKVEQAEGFAQVFPEHKFGIVKSLQQRGHLVAMTGDGVNDAPALKQADVGVAVSGATNAARAAASLVLTAPGLSVIIRAVEEARKIFERMNSYAIYRITETIRIMFFVVLAMLVFNIYPITTVLVILLALLNDLPIMTIAYDNTWLSPQPVRWKMRRVLTVSTVLGLIGVVETFLLLVIAREYLGLTVAQLQSFIYLKLAVAGHLTLLVVRTKEPFWKRPHPAGVLLWAVLGTQLVAVLIVGLGIIVEPIPWSYVGLVWGYCLAWMFIEDLAKLQLYRHLSLGGKHHLGFLRRLKARG